ncbi:MULTISPECIES: flagellar biosynthesis protein FliQ [Neobacillus]|uniref:Flagellar biosynthetic protein FliQ n=1 Tax=Neobacillus rhizophilus TaxID=2833579 RepID=A0A942U557_9BACI|nr:flagellar biosynthesis protein FliQ [Neobacillus rhizophilus]MBS4213052.1 flagellar biosynthesis protein FliQ [Neobacillus rhizophilus]MBU8918268.1 flagellar biosynthesis protein FliQ [Bacillus sp. FJAT-29953]
MTPEMVFEVSRQSVYTTLLVAAPVLGIALVVGLVISIFQSVTQIQEQTLVFVPKIIAVFVGLLLFGPWMLQHLLDFTQNILGNLSHFTG